MSWEYDLLLCENKYIDIELKKVDCAGDGCIVRVDRIPFTLKNYTFPKKLDPCAKYDCRIYEGSIIHDRDIFAKEEFTRVKIQSITQSAGQTQSADLTWLYDGYPDCNTKFRVEVRDVRLLVRQFETSNKSTTIYELTPCESYTFKVFPIGTDREDVIDNWAYRIKYVPPSEVQNLKIEYNSNSNFFDVTWSPPEIGEKCVTTYVFQAFNEYQRIFDNTSTLSYKVTDLFACTIYNITVYPSSVYSDSVDLPIAVTKMGSVPSRGLLTI